jgi:hypothetical protein
LQQPCQDTLLCVPVHQSVSASTGRTAGSNPSASTDPQQRFHIKHHGNRRDGGLSRSSHVEVQRWVGGLISLSPSQIPESFGLFEPKIRHFIAMKRGIISTAELNIHINYV